MYSKSVLTIFSETSFSVAKVPPKPFFWFTFANNLAFFCKISYSTKTPSRLFFLLLVIWAAATITFFIPRLSDKNPIRERFAQLAMTGGFSPEDLEVIIESYNQKFGLDLPLHEQYINYLVSLAKFDLGVSMTKYP